MEFLECRVVKVVQFIVGSANSLGSTALAYAFKGIRNIGVFIRKLGVVIRNIGVFIDNIGVFIGREDFGVSEKQFQKIPESCISI